jgi:hypothetical protein
MDRWRLEGVVMEFKLLIDGKLKRDRTLTKVGKKGIPVRLKNGEDGGGWFHIGGERGDNRCKEGKNRG